MRCRGRQVGWNFLERRLSRLCCRYGYAVSLHPYPFIVLPVLLTCMLSFGWWFRRVSGDALYLYTPQGARSKVDQDAIQTAFPSGDGRFAPGRMVVPNRESSVIAVSKDGGNILRLQQSEAVIRLNQFIIDGIQVQLDSGNYTYRNLCLKSGHHCHNNPQVYIIPQMYHNPGQGANLSYPTAVYDHRQRYYLGSSLAGVKLDPTTGQIAEAEAWLMTYQLRFQTDRDNGLSGLWELQFERALLAYRDPFINFSIAHSQTLNRELARNAKDLYPRFALMFALLVLFAVLCTVTLVWPAGARWPVVDWALSRPNLALLGVLSAGMGVASAIGGLSYLGTPYPDIVTVMPFLIIAVRLDNTFLMIAALDNTRRTLPVEERVAEAMSEAAVSITITVLTDVLSFSCGVLTDFVAVQLFCVYTTVAVLITFAYQLSFLLGFLVLYAKWESRAGHALAPCLATVAPEDTDKHTICVALCCVGSRPATEKPAQSNGGSGPSAEPGSVISRWFRDVYGPFLMNKYTQCAVVLVLVLFWTSSIYGCYNLRQGLEPTKLLVDDSYAIAYFRDLELFWDYGSQMQVIFMRPGDLSDPAVRNTIMDITMDFASQTHSIGMEGVDFWMTSLEQHLLRVEGRSLRDLDRNEFYPKLDAFLSLDENYRYTLDLARGNASGRGDPIVSFRFLLGMKGFRTTDEQRKACQQFRTLALNYSQLDVRVFHIMFLFVDQYEKIVPNVWQEIGSGMVCMIGIALCLIPHPLCSIWVTVAIASIDVGVIGYMTLWGLNMDTISMITIIMSIGFSVDFSAHIAYAYVVNSEEAPVDRVCAALGALGWPVLQGGIATLLGVVVLADLNSYMVVSFFKTVFLVILFGLLHALVFLPVMLNGLTPTSCPAWLAKLVQYIRSKLPSSGKPVTNIATVNRSNAIRSRAEIKENECDQSERTRLPQSPNGLAKGQRVFSISQLLERTRTEAVTGLSSITYFRTSSPDFTGDGNRAAAAAQPGPGTQELSGDVH